MINKNTYINNESYDTITIIESPHYISYKRNPEDNEGKIILTVKGNLIKKNIFLIKYDNFFNNYYQK